MVFEGVGGLWRVVEVFVEGDKGRWWDGMRWVLFLMFVCFSVFLFFCFSVFLFFCLSVFLSI